MAKEIIKTKSTKNTIIKYTRGVSYTTSVKVNGPLDASEYKYLGTDKEPKSFDDSLRNTVIIFMRTLKGNGYPYRPSYRIASNNKTGNESLIPKLKREFSLEPLDTFYVCAEFIQMYHLMKLRKSKGASVEELIQWAFKLGNIHQKALLYLKESDIQTKVAKNSRTDPDIAESITKLAKTDMTAKEAFDTFVNDIDGEEIYIKNDLAVKYYDSFDNKKEMKFKTFQNKLSRQRTDNKQSSKCSDN
jgi:hypothetical protein